MPDFTEPTIIINGQLVDHVGEAMTLRVAVTDFLSRMQEPNVLGDDEHGKIMAANYARHARNILHRMGV